MNNDKSEHVFECLQLDGDSQATTMSDSTGFIVDRAVVERESPVTDHSLLIGNKEHTEDHNTESEDLTQNLLIQNERHPCISENSQPEESIQNHSDSKEVLQYLTVESEAKDCSPESEDLDAQHQNVCRICYGNDEEEELVAPCKCLGTVQYLHESCLLTWLKSGATQCELCKTNYRFRRILKPYSERQWPNARSWHIAWIVKELVILDWFHFLETVLCCITLIMINRMASYDLVYQFALIALFELFYYGLNIWSCFYLLFYTRWSSLNLKVHVLNFTRVECEPSSSKISNLFISGLESYAALLRKNRRLRMVVSSIEENDFA